MFDCAASAHQRLPTHRWAAYINRLYAASTPSTTMLMQCIELMHRSPDVRDIEAYLYLQ